MTSFKEYRDIVKTQMGTEMLNYFVTQTQEYKDSQDANFKQELQTNAFERWSAYLLVKHADWRKYGSLITELKSSYVRSRDEYPRTFEQAVDLLEQHHPDAAWKEHRKQQSKKEDKAKKSGSSFNQKGSTSKDKTPKADLVCYCCGKKGDHRSNECKWETKVPKKDWFMKTGKVPAMVKGSYAQAANDNDDNESEASDDNSSIASERSSRSTSSTRSRSRTRRSGGSRNDAESEPGWSNFIVAETQLHQGDKAHMRDVIILDTGSTINATIMNPDFLTDIHKAKVNLKMTTNAGTKELTLKGTVPGFGEAWYDPEMMANIFSFG